MLKGNNVMRSTSIYFTIQLLFHFSLYMHILRYFIRFKYAGE